MMMMINCMLYRNKYSNLQDNTCILEKEKKRKTWIIENDLPLFYQTSHHISSVKTLEQAAGCWKD